VADCPTKVVGQACGDVVPETRFPSSVVIKKGTQTGGNAASLAADDADYLQVASTTRGKRLAMWFGKFDSVTNALSNLRVTYKGKNAPSCTQKIAIYDWTATAWVTLDSRNVGAETKIADLAPPGAAGNYVSGTAGNGEVRVRLRCQSNANFTASGNLLQVDFDRPA
jgi:hypothetical protein